MRVLLDTDLSTNEAARKHVWKEHGWFLGHENPDHIKEHEQMHAKHCYLPPYGYGPADHIHEETQ